MAKFLYPFWVEQHLLSVMKTGSDITQNTFYMFLSQAFRCLISYYNILFSFFILRQKENNAKERTLRSTNETIKHIFSVFIILYVSLEIDYQYYN